MESAGGTPSRYSTPLICGEVPRETTGKANPKSDLIERRCPSKVSLETADDDCDRVHSIRVQCKRSLALLHLVREALPETSFEQFARGVKAVGKSLSRRRDDAVVQSLLIKPITRYGRKLSRKEAQWLGRYYAHRPPGLAADRIVRAERELRRVIEQLGNVSIEDRRELQPLLRREIERSYQKAQTGFRRARDSGRSRDFHSWRTWTKRLLLQLEFVRLSGFKVKTRILRSLDDGQKRLGECHDFSLTEKIRFQKRGLPKAFKDGLRRQRIAREKRVLREARRTFGLRPAEFFDSCVPSGCKKGR
jgi:CHAD domain-containing protein